MNFGTPTDFVAKHFGLVGLILWIPVYYVFLLVFFSVLILGGIWGTVNAFYWLLLG